MISRRFVVVLALALFGCTVVCGGLPSAAFYAQYGRMPLCGGQNPFDVSKGTPMDEVRERLGEPHDRYQSNDETEVWYYHGDCIGFVIYGMEFDAKGRLVNVWS